jgi:hypothetical protein
VLKWHQKMMKFSKNSARAVDSEHGMPNFAAWKPIFRVYKVIFTAEIGCRP